MPQLGFDGRLSDVGKRAVRQAITDPIETEMEFPTWEGIVSTPGEVVYTRVQCDEIWSFTYAKQKNVATATAAPAKAGDTWTWTALDADSKLIVSWLVGGRDSDYGIAFMDDVASRLANRVQLTTDGHKAYLEALEGAFGADVD